MGKAAAGLAVVGRLLAALEKAGTPGFLARRMKQRPRFLFNEGAR